ncbi:MAG: hypothetical protein ACLQL2_06800 [Methylovirgula sp.]
MLRVDGNYLYQVGAQIHPLAEIKVVPGTGAGPSFSDIFFSLIMAEGALEPLLARSVFQLTTSQNAGQELLAIVRAIKTKAQTSDDWQKPVEAFDVFSLSSAITRFEAVFGAEMALAPLYVVTRKGGFDTRILIERGISCFPSDLALKVPDAVEDVNQAMKCIAFELPTAAGFHLHRANESVLHRYWDCITNNAPRPGSKNIGDYLREMRSKGVGEEKVLSSLRDLKDLHRNPLIHPEHTLETADQAIALMNGVYNVMVHMLAVIPLEIPLAPVGSGPPIGGPSGPCGPALA